MGRCRRPGRKGRHRRGTGTQPSQPATEPEADDEEDMEVGDANSRHVEKTPPAKNTRSKGHRDQSRPPRRSSAPSNSGNQQPGLGEPHQFPISGEKLTYSQVCQRQTHNGPTTRSVTAQSRLKAINQVETRETEITTNPAPRTKELYATVCATGKTAAVAKLKDTRVKTRTQDQEGGLQYQFTSKPAHSSPTPQGSHVHIKIKRKSEGRGVAKGGPFPARESMPQLSLPGIRRRRPRPKHTTNGTCIKLPDDCRLPRNGHIPPEIWRDEIKSKHMKGGAQYTADKSYFNEDIKEEDVKEMISETAEHPDQICQSNENKKWLLFREYEEPVGRLGVNGEECPWILVTSKKKNGHMVDAYPYDDPDNIDYDYIVYKK